MVYFVVSYRPHHNHSLFIKLRIYPINPFIKLGHSIKEPSGLYHVAFCHSCNPVSCLGIALWVFCVLFSPAVSCGLFLFMFKAREDELGEQIPHTWVSYIANYLKSIFDAVWLF